MRCRLRSLWALRRKRRSADKGDRRARAERKKTGNVGAPASRAETGTAGGLFYRRSVFEPDASWPGL